MSQAIKPTLMAAGNAPIRCDGTLAVGVVMPNNTVLTRRVRIGGCLKLTVRAKGTTVAGTPKLDIKGILADGGDTEGTGTQAATANATQATLTSSEVTSSFTTNGELFVDVILTCGAGDTYTITYVDLFFQPIYG